MNLQAPRKTSIVFSIQSFAMVNRRCVLSINVTLFGPKRDFPVARRWHQTWFILRTTVCRPVAHSNKTTKNGVGCSPRIKRDPVGSLIKRATLEASRALLIKLPIGSRLIRGEHLPPFVFLLLERANRLVYRQSFPSISEFPRKSLLLAHPKG